MKTTIMSLVFASLLPSLAYAGAANIVVNCKSADGKVSLKGNVPGDMQEFALTADISGNQGGLTMKLYSETNQQTGKLEANARIAVVEDLANAVFTVSAEDLNGEGIESIRLYALPKTVKYQRHHSVFIGKLEVSGENGGTNSTVYCTTDYSI